MNGTGHVELTSPIAASDESTVIGMWEEPARTANTYQSEADLERELIATLTTQAYEYVTFDSEDELLANLRRQLERLNSVSLTDSEWSRLLHGYIANPAEGVLDKTERIQHAHVIDFELDSGAIKNIMLLDKEHIHNNHLQVTNQYAVDTESGALHSNRYDVTILVNGLPLVHVELKRRGVDIKEAFNQIKRYDHESFFAGAGLFNYVQLYVISNGTLTKYYSNTVRQDHLADKAVSGSTAGASSTIDGRNRSRATASFEFTCWWADGRNQRIADLTSFARTFLSKRTLLNVLTKYCVFNTSRKLLVMRPYQIAACERILQKITTTTNLKQFTSPESGGYVWHTTGSGKTLTSFKTAQLAAQMPEISKVIFVVDRADLDAQTVREYDKFEKGAANGNINTAVLTRNLEDPSRRILITTIQKLAVFLKKNQHHEVFREHIVFIFDECHRSQFGEMHQAIRKHFKKYHMFGFTGTPIFDMRTVVREIPGAKNRMHSTEKVFGQQLHAYTIVDAIADQNVLPFKVSYIETVPSTGETIDYDHGGRIKAVVSSVLTHFDAVTYRGKHYDLDDKRVRGFNALFAAQSIPAAKKYYTEFMAQLAALPESQRLTIGIIFSYGANSEGADVLDAADVRGSVPVPGGDGAMYADTESANGLLEEEQFRTDMLSAPDKEFLEKAVTHYNEQFHTNFNIGSGFDEYYNDVALRLRQRTIDLVIVVNMFLTGFDAPSLNTLFVDKNLRMHGLIQAFSRTNRILNSVKDYGNIICFRDLESATNEALVMYGNRLSRSVDARQVALVPSFSELFEEYANAVNELVNNFPLPTSTLFEILKSEEKQKEFIGIFGKYLRLDSMLRGFPEFAGQRLLTVRDEQDYKSEYLRLSDEYKQKLANEQALREAEEKAETGDGTALDDVVFELELIKQVEINVDYILKLVNEHLAKQTPALDEKARLREEVERAVDASPTLRPRKPLIVAFVDHVVPDRDIDDQWHEFITEARDTALHDIITSENLKPTATRAFVRAALREGELRTSGTGLPGLLPKKTSRFAKGANSQAAIKARVAAKLTEFFDLYHGLITDREESSEVEENVARLLTQAVDTAEDNSGATPAYLDLDIDQMAADIVYATHPLSILLELEVPEPYRSEIERIATVPPVEKSTTQ